MDVIRIDIPEDFQAMSVDSIGCGMLHRMVMSGFNCWEWEHQYFYYPMWAALRVHGITVVYANGSTVRY